MAHAGTMDLRTNAQSKKSGSRWPALMLTLVVVVATIAAVWFASSAGLVGGTAKPESVTYVNRYGPPNAADRSFDQIEAQRGAVALPNNLSVRRGYAAGAVTLPANLSVRRGYAIEAQPGAVTLPDNLSARRGYAAGAVTLPANLSVRRGYAIEDAQTVPMNATSGTFHLGR